MNTVNTSTANTAASPAGYETPGDLMAAVLDDYLASLSSPITMPQLFDPAFCKGIRSAIMSDSYVRADIENANRPKSGKFRIPSDLPAWIAARLVLGTGDILVLSTDVAGNGDVLAMRKYYRNASTGNAPRWAGTWTEINADDDACPIYRVFDNLCPTATKTERNKFAASLWGAPHAKAEPDPNLIFFRNGVWDCKTRSFTAYDDPSYHDLYDDKITLSKLPIPWAGGPGSPIQVNADGTLPPLVLHNDDDGTDWTPLDPFTAPFDMDTDVGQASSKLLLQTAQFMLRRYNGQFGYYQFWRNMSGLGRNGKGCLSDLMSMMVQRPLRYGDDDLDNCVRIVPMSVEMLKDDFKLANNIETAYAIIGEESRGSDGGSYVSDCDKFKMLCRGQSMQYRKIYGKPYTYAYRGVLIQQSQKSPRFAEKTESVISHTFCIPFERSFIGTDCRTYIKSDYVRREDVAVWLAYYVTAVLPTYDDYDADAVATLKPYRDEVLADSMNTVQYLDEALPLMPMDIMPAEMLYSLYIRWAERQGYSGVSVVNFKSFRDDCEQYAVTHPSVTWTTAPKRVAVEDIDNPNRALYEWGYSQRLGVSEYATRAAGCDPLGRDKKTLFLDKTMFYMPGSDTERKRWKTGCIVRTESYKGADWWDAAAHNYAVDAD